MTKKPSKPIETGPQQIAEAQVSVSEDSAQEAAETAASEETAEEQERVAVVVCAYPGTEELMSRLWDKFHKGKHIVVTIPETLSRKEILGFCIADEQIADKFTLLPPNIIPCVEITDELLKGDYVYVSGNGDRQADSRVPMNFDKTSLVDILADENSEALGDKELLENLAKGKRMMEVSFAFGNFITPVLRANPCENVVIEAFLRKFFVAASPEGFAAIASLAEKSLLKG